MSYKYRFTVRFHHVDRAGIAFFARAFEYAHDCFDEMLMEAFGHPDLDELGFGMPLVSAEASYDQPLRLYDKLEIQARIQRVGERSVTYAHTVVDESGQTRCTVRLRHAFVSFPEFKSCPVPQVFIDQMRTLDLFDDSTTD